MDGLGFKRLHGRISGVDLHKVTVEVCAGFCDRVYYVQVALIFEEGAGSS